MKSIHLFTFHIGLILLTLSFLRCVEVAPVEKVYLAMDESKKPSYQDNIRSIFIDSQEVIWLGVNDGVYRYDETSITHHIGKKVSSIMEDRDERLWLGTADGLYHYSKNTFTHVPIPFSDTSSLWLDKVYPVINPNEVISMLQDQEGTFWLGTNGAGVYRYDGDSFTNYLSKSGRKQIDSLYHNIIMSITQDQQGDIWFTSRIHGGLVQLDRSQPVITEASFRHYNLKDGLKSDMFNTSVADNTGGVWFGSLGNTDVGLIHYNTVTAKFSQYSEADGMCNNNIHNMHHDSQGNLWLASHRGALCIYDGSTFNAFTDKDGRQFEGINYVTGDQEGNIWFGGTGGQLFKYDPKSKEVIDVLEIIQSLAPS